MKCCKKRAVLLLAAVGLIAAVILLTNMGMLKLA